MNRLAIVSALGNLLGVPVGTVVSLVTGYRARRQIRSSDGRQRGSGLALFGIAWAWTALAMVLVVLLVIAVSGPRSATPEEAAAADRAYEYAHRAYEIAKVNFKLSNAPYHYPGGWVHAGCVDWTKHDRGVLYSELATLAARRHPTEANVKKAHSISRKIENLHRRQVDCSPDF